MRNKIIIGVLIAGLVIATGSLAQQPDGSRQPRPGRMAALDLTQQHRAKIRFPISEKNIKSRIETVMLVLWI